MSRLAVNSSRQLLIESVAEEISAFVNRKLIGLEKGRFRDFISVADIRLEQRC